MATGGLDDFSNNLASDLGPLLALFGDAVTKQYLSECTTWVDYLIFAVAPLGLVTAVVSVIRACGDSSLRAFIGRAQEGDGVVEAELCTSTSRDVCELFNKGGITRVLGRPKILEIMKYRNDAYRKADPTDESAGLFLFRDYVSRLDPEDEEWKIKGSRRARHRAASDGGPRPWHRGLFQCLQLKEVSGGADPEDARKQHEGNSRKAAKVPFYLPSPNISLNVGIIKRSPWAFYAVALVGFSLQAGVVAAAVVLTWTLEWGKDGAPKEFVSFRDIVHGNSAPLLFIIGTTFMCSGMFCCAALIGQSTQEQVYLRKNPTDLRVASRSRERQDAADAGQPSQLFWLQPGNQLVGDETYDAYAYSEDKDKPMAEYITSVKIARPREHLYTWIVIVMTIGGYITQFVGLRGMHAYISLAQLGITVIMGFLRGSLRMQRLTRSANKLRLILDKVTGHELDWLALELSKEETESPASTKSEDSVLEPGRPRQGKESSPPVSTSRLSWYPNGKVRSSLATGTDGTAAVGPCSLAERTLRYRTRLAKLTGHGACLGAYQEWKDEQVLVRAQARRVAKAICQTAQIVLGDDYTRDIRLSFEIVMGAETGPKTSVELLLQAPKPAERRVWYLDSSVLEGILGLWTWSLKYSKDFDKYDEENTGGTVMAESLPKARIISTNLSSDILCDHGFLDLWLGQSHSQIYEAVIVPRGQADCCSMTIWTRTSGLGKSEGKPDAANAANSHITSYEHWIPVSIPVDSNASSKETLQKSAIRFFGWNQVRVWPSSPDQRLHVYYAETEQSLSTECGLELFSYAIQALASHSKKGRQLAPLESSARKAAWANSEITNLCMGLLESGMSDYSSALLCVISGLEGLLHMPGDECDVLDLIGAASHYRKMGQWRRAERILQWACSYYSTNRAAHSDGDPESKNPINVAYKFAGLGRKRSLRMACTALGELYRWALLERDDATRSWGSRGLGLVIKNLPRVVEDDKISQIIERYSALHWYLGKEHNGKSADANDPGSYDDLLPDEEDMGQLHDISEFARLLYTYGRERAEGNFTKEIFENDGGEEVGFHLKGAPPSRSISQSESQATGAAESDIVGRPSDDERISWFRKSQRHRITALIRLCALAKTGNAAALWPLRGVAVSTGWFEVLLAVVDMEDGSVSSTNKDNGVYSSVMLDDVVAARILLSGIEDADQLSQEIGTMVAKEGSLGILGLLLDNGIIDPFWADARGRTILSLAAEEGKVHLVDFLLSLKEVDPDSRDNAGRTALSYAAMEGHFPVANLLVSTGRVNPDSGDHMGHSPLLLAILHRGDDDTVNLLVTEDRVNVNLQSTDGDNPVLAAARRARASILAQLALASYNVNANVQDGRGRTPFLLAVENGHLECARILVERLRADPTARDDQGRTALFTLVSRARRGAQSDFAMLRYLLHSERLDLNVRDREGDTALHRIFADVEDEDDYASGTLRRLLQESELDPNIKNRHGRTALHEFVASSRPDIDYHVETFLEHPQIDPLTQDRRGQTLLHSSADALNEGVFKLLLEDKRIDPSIPDGTGATPLHAAVFTSFRSGLSRILEDERTRPDATNKRGDTALHVAVKSNNADAVRMLLMSGRADPNIRNRQGHTPLHSSMHCLKVDTLITRYLLDDERVDVNAEDDEGRTVIWVSARSFLAFVREFEHDASESEIAKNPSGYARYQKEYEEMQRKVDLVWNSARVARNHRDKMGRTVLHAAAVSGEGIEYIVAQGVDPDTEDVNSERAIDLAHTTLEAERIRIATESGKQP